MLLVSVIFFLASTKSIAIALTCPYQSLASDAWRGLLLGFHNDNRRTVATEGLLFGQPKAKQMNELAWNCDTEYNLSKMQLELNSNDTVVYRDFGVNFGLGEARVCNFKTMYYIIVRWVTPEDQFPMDLQYNGNLSILPAANAVKWNSTEVGCAYRSFDSGNSVRLICAYNVRADIVGQPIYEAGNGTCSEGAKCGNDGTCVKDLCRVPTPNPDVLLPIYTPSLQCSSSTFMSQFSRYYAVNMHNYYRRLVASGWAKSKLTVFAPRASGMAALSYNCSLEKEAAENVEKCEGNFYRKNKNSMTTGSNTAFIKDNNISKEAAVEQAMSEWFSELEKYEVDPNSVWTNNAATADVANVMHEKYKFFGCAVNNCATRGFTLVECRYGPKILQSGDTIYNAGAPCSKCEKSEKCVFEALCQV